MERKDWTLSSNTELINLSNNVCIDEYLIKKISSDSEILSNCFTYPKEFEIYETISKYYGIDAKKIAIGLGSTELIQRILFILKDKKIKILSPTFEMVKVYCSILGISYSEETYEYFDSIKIDKLINNEVLYLANPNGNNGHSFNENEIEFLVKHNDFVILDEAYIEYSLHSTIFPLIKKYNNLVVLRTFSKSLGIAGTRCGFCYSNEYFVKKIQDIRMNYVSCGIAPTILKKYITEVPLTVERMKYAKYLLSKKYNVLNKNGNFICIQDKLEDFKWCLYKKCDGYVRITLINHEVFKDNKVL